jgi:organic radical activating enzyme
MQLAEYKYIEAVSKQLNINYPYSWSNLAVQKDVNTALAMLFYGFNLESMLHNTEYINNAKTIYNGIVDKVAARALVYCKDNVDSDDDYAYLEKVFYQIKNYRSEAVTPYDLLQDWPVLLSPSPFEYRNQEDVPHPYYVVNTKDENYTRWGRDPFITIEFSLFTGCQVNCSYCPHLSFHKASRDKYMPFDVFKTMLDKIPKEVGIVFAGFCDPLLYDDLARVVKYTHEQGYRIYLSTTFPDKFPENIELFLNQSYWTGRCVHLRDEHMSYKSNSELYYNSLDVFFSQVSSQYKDNNIKIDNRFSFLGSKVDERVLQLLKQHNLEHLFSVCKPHTRITAPIKYKDARQTKGLTGKIYCSVGFYKRPMISPDGDVVLDCMDVEKTHVLGNLLTCSYEELFTGEEYNRVLRGFNKEEENIICRNCIYGKQIG